MLRISTHVIPQDDFTLSITFQNGEIGILDMKPYASSLYCPDGTRRDVNLSVNRNSLNAVDDTFYIASRQDRELPDLRT